MKNVSHPNILQIIDSYQNNVKDTLFLHIVSPMYSSDLHRMLRDKLVKVQQIPLFLFQILKAMAYMKERGIVHCNLTPSNILVNKESEEAIVAGFGSATYDCGF